MGTQKTTKLAPYSRGNKEKVELKQTARSASIPVVKSAIKRRAIDAFFMGRGNKPTFDWKAYNSRPVYIPLLGAPGFNHF